MDPQGGLSELDKKVKEKEWEPLYKKTACARLSCMSEKAQHSPGTLQQVLPPQHPLFCPPQSLAGSPGFQVAWGRLSLSASKLFPPTSQGPGS